MKKYKPVVKIDLKKLIPLAIGLILGGTAAILFL